MSPGANTRGTKTTLHQQLQIATTISSLIQAKAGSRCLEVASPFPEASICRKPSDCTQFKMFRTAMLNTPCTPERTMCASSVDTLVIGGRAWVIYTQCFAYSLLPTASNEGHIPWNSLVSFMTYLPLLFSECRVGGEKKDLIPAC